MLQVESVIDQNKSVYRMSDIADITKDMMGFFIAYALIVTIFDSYKDYTPYVD